jgi:hypothetical protein
MLPTPIRASEAVAAHPAAGGFRLCYRAARGGPSLSFPCDVAGRVHIDALDARETANYLLARALVGRDYEVAVVLPDEAAPTAVPPDATRQPDAEPVAMERGLEPRSKMPPTPFFDLATGVLRFWVLHDDGRYIGASIGRQTLHYRFSGESGGEDAVATYEANRQCIDDAVRRRTAAGSREPVMLRDPDVAVARQ